MLSRFPVALCFALFLQFIASSAHAQSTFAGNAQHTAIYAPPAQALNSLRWSTPVDLNFTVNTRAHYGQPLLSAANTILVPIKTGLTDGFRVDAFDASNGTQKYSLGTDYTQPAHAWILAYQPVLATSAGTTRLYYAAAGGTLLYIDDIDTAAHGAPVRRVFYTSPDTYLANAAAYNASIFVNTPLTADSNGNVFFGFRLNGVAAAPSAPTEDGFVRIDPAGNATIVLAGTAAADAAIGRTSHNSAPALSNDEATLYVVVKGVNSDAYAYLLGLDATTLATKHKVLLKDPRNGGVSNAQVSDLATSSATVGPDGDVYFGVFGSTANGSRGFLLHFNADLTVQKTPGGFGWDNTVAIVPAGMVPSYSGASTYLLFTKYNNYTAGAADKADGTNRIAILDPNDGAPDYHPSSGGLAIMREVLTMLGPTPDVGSRNATYPRAVREWCINTAAVNPATQSVLTPSEDGHLYRWNLATNSIDQGIKLNPGILEPYVPTLIGPTGLVYTLSGAVLSAVGEVPGVRITIASSSPAAGDLALGDPVAFDITVANTGASGSIPSGTIALQTTTYAVPAANQLTPTTTTLAPTLTLDAGGIASFTTTALPAATHFVAASYSGDANFAPTAALRIQDVAPKLAATQFTGSTTTGSGTTTLAVSGGGCTLESVLPTYAWPPPPPAGLSFVHGLLSFNAIGCTGGALTAAITYPAPLPAGTRYFKYGATPTNATPHWYVLPAAIAGNQAQFTIVDGGLGDGDLAFNGSIADPGGPAVPDGTVVFNTDVDVDAQSTALTDGLLVLRYLFGMTGEALIANAVGANATLTTAPLLATRLNQLAPLFDIDGNGQPDALTDGLLLVRYLSGLRGAALTEGALGFAAQRTTAAEIEPYIAQLLPPP